MKFQNSSIHGFKVMLCIKKRDGRTDGRTDGRAGGRAGGRTDGRTDRRTTQKQYAPPTSLKLGA